MKVTHTLSKTLLRAIAWALIGFTASAAFAQAAANQVQELPSGQTLEREPTGAETHRYKFDMQANEFFQVRVEQKGVDVVLKLTDVSGKMLAMMDSPNGKQGPETLSFVADRSGRFILEVTGVDAKSAKGNYSIRRAASHAASPTDRRRVDVERLFMEGMTILTKAAPGSSETEAGLARLEEANKGWHELADTEMVTLTERRLRVGRLIAQFLAPTILVSEGQKLRNKGTVESLLAARAKFLEAVDAGHKFMKRLNEEDLSDVLTKEVKAGLNASTIQNDVQAFGGIANTYELLKDWQGSVSYNQQALVIIQETRRNPEVSATLAAQNGIPIKASEASLLNSIGSTLTAKLDKPDQGLKYSAQAVAEWEEVEREYEKFRTTAQQQQALALQNVAQSYFALDDRRKAIESFEKALALFRKLGGQESMEAECLIQIADYSSRDLDYQHAREALDEALKIYETLGNKPGQSTVLGLMGLSYFVLNDQSRAREFFNRELSILLSDDYLESLLKANPTIILPPDYKVDPANLSAFYRDNFEWQRSIDVGYIYNMLEEPDKARAYFVNALTAARATKSMGPIHTTLNAIGITYSNQTRWSEAEDYYKQALKIGRQLPQKTDLASDLSGLTFVQIQLKNWSEALKNATEALLLYQSLGADRKYLLVGYASTLNLIARIQDELGNRRLAIFYEKQAVNAIQRERQQLKKLDLQSQRGFLQQNEKPYRRLIDWLIAEGRLVEAEQVLRMLKDEEVSDYLRGRTAAEQLSLRVDFTAEEQRALRGYDENAKAVSALGVEFEKVKALEKRQIPLVAEQQARLKELQAKLTGANDAFQKFLDQLAVEFKRSRSTPVELAEDSGLQSDMREWGGGLAFVYTLEGEERSRTILITPEAKVTGEKVIRAADLDQKILQFREQVSNPRVDPRPLGKELYDILIKPIEKELDGAKAKTLLWSLDGNLRLLPLAALWDGKEYFGQKYQNVVVTLASRSRMGREVSPNPNVLALGVSETQTVQEPLGERSLSFSGLPGVPRELAAIVQSKQSPRGVLPGESLLNASFNRKSLTDELMKHFKIIHIASHFSLNAGDASRSYLVLGDGSILTVNEFNNDPSLKLDGVELLTLSACETAVSGTNNSGREVDGFAYVAQQKGAKAILASLWPVADESTSILMSEFYRVRKENPRLTKSEALQLAQKEMIEGKLKRRSAGVGRDNPSDVKARSSRPMNLGVDKAPVFVTDPAKPYAHPYYWSPFILIGNWK